MNAWVCASILSCSAAAEHGEIHVQEPVPAEARVNQKKGKNLFPSSSGTFSASFLMKSSIARRASRLPIGRNTHTVPEVSMGRRPPP